MDRAPVFETGSHRFNPCHPRSWGQGLVMACSETNKWTVAFPGVQFPTSPHLQVAKWEGVGLQNRLFVGSIPTLESKHYSVA